MAANLGSGNAGVTGGSSSHSTSVTIPGGTDIFFVLAFRTILDANTPAAPTSATIAGAAMTAVGQLPTGDQNTEWISMYYTLSPPTGAQTVAVSGGGGAAIDTGFMWSAYSGAQQSGQLDSTGKTNQITTTALGVATTVVAANSWVVVGFANQGLAPTSYTNGTSRVFAVPNDGAGIVDSDGGVAAGSYTITVNQPSQRANGIAVSFVATATAATTSANKLTILGVS